MTHDQERASALYGKLLNCYPRVFRERFGESMEQTFDDLYKERNQRAGSGLLGFVLWIFVETAIGVVRERVLLLMEMSPMKHFLTSVSAAAIISLLFTLPFTILELTTMSDAPRSRLSIAGYIFMWLLPMIFVLILMPLIRRLRAGNSITAHPVALVLRGAFLAMLAWSWVGFIIDQWPCFLGATGC
jgi:hypothetical protein